MEEIIGENHAIVSTLWAQLLSFVHKDLLESGCSVLLNHKMRAVVGVLTDGTDLLVTVMTPPTLEDLQRYWGEWTTESMKLRALRSFLLPILSIMKRWG